MIKSIESFIEAVRADSTSTARRAQWFLRDALAHGPKRVSDVEEAAAKAYVDPQNAGASARRARCRHLPRQRRRGPGVQWSLPG
jgi:hypothetical protein